MRDRTPRPSGPQSGLLPFPRFAATPGTTAMTPCQRFLLLPLLTASVVGCASTGALRPAPGDGALPVQQAATPTPPSLSIQFDRKGVDFDPWMHDLRTRLRANWHIPIAAMRSKGHVVVTLSVNRNGTISDLAVLRPSPIANFNSSAYHAVASAGPLPPLPSTYPDGSAFLAITFYFNEAPPRGR